MAGRGLRGWAAGSGWEGQRRAGGGTGLGALAGTAVAVAALAAGAAAGAQTAAAGALRAAARGAGAVAAEHKLKGGQARSGGTARPPLLPRLPLCPSHLHNTTASQTQGL